jgi:hypothetical protein
VQLHTSMHVQMLAAGGRAAGGQMQREEAAVGDKARQAPLGRTLTAAGGPTPRRCMMPNL